MNHWEADLVVLVPDRDMEAAVSGLLSRPTDLGIQPVGFQVLRHPHRDPGCFLRSHDFLRPMLRRLAHGLVLFDRMGSGREEQTPAALENAVGARLAVNGWENRAAAVVLDPELEAWVWSDSAQVDRCLGWEERQPDLRAWLVARGMWIPGEPKPADPKAATEAAMRNARKPRSSSVYEELAKSVDFQGCRDASFIRFRQLLAGWFSP